MKVAPGSVQVPGLHVSCWPTCGVPLMVGGAVFTGMPAGGSIVTAAEYAAVPGPKSLLATTRQ